MSKSTIWRMRRLYDGLKPIDLSSMNEFESLPMNADVFIEIKDLSKKDVRKACQNRLMWMWFHDAEKTTCNEAAGTTSHEWHLQMKRKFLLPIYERDDQEWAETLANIREVYRSGLKEIAEGLIVDIVKRHLSTTEATVEQFCEYLTNIERYFHSKGILLRTDAGLYQAAMHG